MKILSGSYDGDYLGDWVDGLHEEWFDIDANLISSPVYAKERVWSKFTLEEIMARNGVSRQHGLVLEKAYKQYFGKHPDKNGNRNYPQNPEIVMEDMLVPVTEFSDGYSIVHTENERFNPRVDEFTDGCIQLPAPYRDYWLFRSSDSDDAIGVLFKWIQHCDKKYWMYVAPTIYRGTVEFNMRKDCGHTGKVSLSKVYGLVSGKKGKKLHSNGKFGRLAIKNYVIEDLVWGYNDKEKVYDKGGELERDFT